MFKIFKKNLLIILSVFLGGSLLISLLAFFLDGNNFELGLKVFCYFTGGSIVFIFVIIPILTIFSIFYFQIFFFPLLLLESYFIDLRNKYYHRIKYSDGKKKLPPMSQVDYYREIPCQCDLDKIYYLCLIYRINKRKLRKCLIEAYLLKWYQKKYIDISTISKKTVINFNNKPQIKNKIENSLWDIMTEASGDNKYLEPREFAKWCKNNRNKIKAWFNMVTVNVEKDMIKMGLIEKTVGKKSNISITVVSEQLYLEALNVLGYKKFLLHFSLFANKEYKEAHLWNNHMIVAELLGIAKKVQKQLKKTNYEFASSELNDDIQFIFNEFTGFWLEIF